jgi:polyphosphate kinase
MTTRFINRELSWLEFNQRVLDEGCDSTVPYLERLKFLAISDSNLKEFFMVRVGGLQGVAAEGRRKRDESGMTAKQQLKAIGSRVRKMMSDQYELFAELERHLEEHGIVRLRVAPETRKVRSYLESYFENHVLPVVTPQIVPTTGRFPQLKQEVPYLAVRLKSGTRRNDVAIVPLQPKLKRFIPIPGDEAYGYVLLEDLAKLFVEKLFIGKKVLETATFKITRNADMSVREDSAFDLLSEMQSVLTQRESSRVVRLIVDGSCSKSLLSPLVRRLGVDTENVYRADGPLGLSDFMTIACMDGFNDLTYSAWPPQPHPEFDQTKSIFSTIAKRDRILNHPFDSYEPVVRMVHEAANDPDVLAIKMVLYRTASDSRIVDSLERAALNGKYVTVLVELKARFDEGRNIRRARKLEDAGVQVVYGVKGLKTHAKICVVVRRDAGGIVRYCHFGTGNYNESTAKLYGDVSYFTCNPELGNDASAFFNAVCGVSEPVPYAKLEMAPNSLKRKIIELIEGEAEQKRQGRKAGIVAKMNSLVDQDVIDALYDASQAGVKITLNIRGICCLDPGVKGLSETIQVTSIIDRYLEHSRIFSFHHGGDELIYISSADWMPRNLERRVELMIPIEDDRCKQTLQGILDSYFLDTAKGRWIQPDNVYVKRSAKKPVRIQELLYSKACEAVDAARRKRITQLEPHVPPTQSGE